MLLSAFALPAFAGETAPQPHWIEVKLPGEFFTVVTDAGEKAGKRIAFQLAQFDRVLQMRFSWIQIPAVTDAPLLVFASADEGLVRSLAPDTDEVDKDSLISSYWAMPWLNLGAVRADLRDPSDKERSPYRGFFRGRAAYLIDRSLGESAPSWLSRGLATFLSDTVVKEKEVLVGRMTAAPLEGRLLPAMTSVEFFREGRGIDRKFDFQAGFFIHYLLVADGGKNAAAFDALLHSLAAKQPPAGVQAALAKVTSLYSGFPKYFASKKFSAWKRPVDPSVVSSAFGVRSLPLGEALMQRAGVLVGLNRPVDARGLLRQVKAADPSLARPYEMEAFLFDREQRTAESKQAIEGAIQRGSENFHLYYRLAQLNWSPRMTRTVLESIQKLLETARDQAPGDAKVLSYLAETQSDLGLTAPALVHAERAARAAPVDVYAQMALARAQWNARQTDAALITARPALALAKVASQKQRVQEFLAFATKNKRAQAAGTKPYLTQFGPPPAGAFGATRSVGATGRVNVGSARTDSAEASAITDCFTQRDDAACARAVPALEAACGERQATSCVSLGSLYDGGFGIRRDKRKAAAAYKAACDLSDKPGCARLAVLEAQGLGVPRNTLRATRTLDRLCGEKVPEACIGLAQILQQTGFATDRTRARSLLKSACEGGAAEACALLTSR